MRLISLSIKNVCALALFLVSGCFGGTTKAATITASISGFVRDIGIDGTPDGVNSMTVSDAIKTTTWPVGLNHNVEDRAIAEFDLSLITGPVDSATLTIPVTTNNMTQAHLFGIYGYTGDGAITLSDYSSGALLSDVSINAGSLATITVDVAGLINALIALNDQYAGFRIGWEDAAINSFQFVQFSNLSKFFSLSYQLAPNPAPLPPALPLFAAGLGALGLLGWRRKKEGNSVRRFSKS